MPLKPGKSRDVISYNIGEMLRSTTFAEGKSSKKRRSMAAAAAYDKARSAGAVLPRKRSKSKHKSNPLGSEGKIGKYKHYYPTKPSPKHEKGKMTFKKTLKEKKKGFFGR